MIVTIILFVLVVGFVIFSCILAVLLRKARDERNTWKDEADQHERDIAQLKDNQTTIQRLHAEAEDHYSISIQMYQALELSLKSELQETKELLREGNQFLEVALKCLPTEETNHLYTAKIPFKDFNGKARGTASIQFNLTEREVFKLLMQFQAIFKWQDKLKENPDQETPTEEVITFYTNFEEIILAAYGQLSDDGLYFRKDDRFNFEDSAMFAAAMAYYVSDVRETSKLIDGLMPTGLEDIVKKADESLAALAADPGTEDELRAELARLRAQQASASPTETPVAASS